MLLVLFILVVLIPISLLLLLIWLFSKKKLFGKAAGCIWIFIFSFFLLLFTIEIFTTKKEIEKDDIYGDYVIDRSICKGKQANWQYNHYRFKITEDNKIFFYITEKENIIKTYEGTVEIKEFYTPSPHLKINFDEPKFHIIKDNPTLYRTIWSFYYVFHSEKYQNVFFTKGRWKAID